MRMGRRWGGFSCLLLGAKKCVVGLPLFLLSFCGSALRLASLPRYAPLQVSNADVRGIGDLVWCAVHVLPPLPRAWLSELLDVLVVVHHQQWAEEEVQVGVWAEDKGVLGDLRTPPGQLSILSSVRVALPPYPLLPPPTPSLTISSPPTPIFPGAPSVRGAAEE
jgi:hypothetical protein